MLWGQKYCRTLCVEKETITKQQREAQKLMLTGLELAFIIFERPKNEWPQDGCATEVGCYLFTDRNGMANCPSI
jgi:hypothetical protein